MAPEARGILDPGALAERWAQALAKEYVRPLVETGVHAGALTLPYPLLHRADLDLAEELLARPRATLDASRAALPIGAPPLRVVELGEGNRVPIRHLRPMHLGRFVSVEGLVKRASTIRPGVVEAAWRCRFCEALVTLQTSGAPDLEPPAECNADDGGCGKKTGAFDLDEDRCVKVATQHLELQESPEALVGGEQPGRLPFLATLDLCGAATPGDRVVVNGILRDVRKRKTGGRVDAVSDFVLHGISVERRSQGYEDVALTPEDEAAVRQLAANPQVFDLLTESVAPGLFGLEDEKLAVALQLFGGVERHHPDGLRVRGDIHVLLLGDPGIAKSMLLRSAARLSPRGIFTSGKGSSAAGLTASVQRDPETERWTFEAGAMVLADRGLCAVDEIDKMRDDDRDAILPALEQGVVTLNKAGLSVELNARCSVLGAGNPKDGRFDAQYAALSEQIELSPPLLSRFDLIFLMMDVPDEVRDRAVIRHINQPPPEAPIPVALLRKFVAYARHHCRPVESPVAAQRIEDFYVQIRRAGNKDGKPRTPRQGEAVKRLAQAAARVRLSALVEEQDVDLAIRLVHECLDRLGGDEDKVVAGTSSRKRDAVKTVLDLVGVQGPMGATEDQVVSGAWAVPHGIPERRVREILDELLTRGRLTWVGGRLKRKEAA